MIFKTIKKSPKLLQILKVFGISLVGIFGFLYLAFLLILPNVINLNNFMPMIKEEMAKITPLKLDVKNPKLKTNFKLGLGIIADNINLKYSTGENFVNIDNPKIEINIPQLLLKTITIDTIYAKKIDISLIFEKNKYTILDYFTPTQTNENAQETPDLGIKIGKINSSIENFNLNLIDKDIQKTFNANAKNTKLTLNSLNSLYLETVGEIKKVNPDKKYLDFDVKLNTVLPKFEESEDANAKTPEIKLINPFATIDKLSPYSKLSMDLKIKNLEDFSANGYLKLQDGTLVLNNTKLPKSYIDSEFNKNKIKFDTNLYIAQNEFFDADGNLEIGKKPKIELAVKSEHASLNNIIKHLGAVLNLFNIENDFKNIIATGAIVSDFSLKSDFKKLESKGQIVLPTGSIKYPKMNINLSNIKAFVDLNGNKLTIKDTSALLNNAKFEAFGTIDTNSNMNIKINSDNLKISELIKLGESLKLIKASDLKDFAFNSGTLTMSGNIAGKIEEPNIKGNVVVNSLGILVKSIKTPINISKITFNAIPNKDKLNLNGGVENLIIKPQGTSSTISIAKAEIIGDEEKINIKPFHILTTGETITASGSIEDYMKNPEIAISGKGNVAPLVVLSFLPNDIRKNITYAGKIPVDFNITGTMDNLDMAFNATVSPTNYINFVDIQNIKGITNKISANLKLSKNSLEITNISCPKVISVKGKIDNIYSKIPTISNLNVDIPQKLNLVLKALDNISLSLKGNISAQGAITNPIINGNLSITNLNYPKMKVSSPALNIDFKKSLISANSQNLKVGNSDFRGEVGLLSDFSKGIILNNVNFSSNLIDSDEILKLMASAPNTQTTAGPMPNITIKQGKGVIAKLTSGNAVIENINFDFNMFNNLVKLKNLTATAYTGRVSGSIDYDVAKLKTGIDLVGKDINVSTAAKAFTGLIVPTSGKLDGIIKASFTGATFDAQMRTLSGNAKFSVKNGTMKDFIKFENFLYASNILSQNILGFNLNNAISSVKRINTGTFNLMEGYLTFGNSWANVKEFKTQGQNMSLWAEGKYNLLTNYADMNILGQISQHVVHTLGPLGDFSLNKVLEKIPEKGLMVLEIVKSVAPKNPLLSNTKPQNVEKIPALTSSTNEGSKKFQVVILGNVASTKSVKSFKWINENP